MRHVARVEGDGAVVLVLPCVGFDDEVVAYVGVVVGYAAVGFEEWLEGRPDLRGVVVLDLVVGSFFGSVP